MHGTLYRSSTSHECSVRQRVLGKEVDGLRNDVIVSCGGMYDRGAKIMIDYFRWWRFYSCILIFTRSKPPGEASLLYWVAIEDWILLRIFVLLFV